METIQPGKETAWEEYKSMMVDNTGSNYSQYKRRRQQIELLYDIKDKSVFTTLFSVQLLWSHLKNDRRTDN